MNKQILISDALSKLTQLGINYSVGQGTDVSIRCEFLDAGWGTGNKKISYETSAYLDENSQTIFMWEMTKEVGSGFSFGGDSESSFQSGATLFRKVKSVQYGPDGKAYEYTLDLGAIPKAFKDAAKQYGWKFKTVLKRDKASYPQGYAPFANVNQPQMAYGQASPQMPPMQQYTPQPAVPFQNQSFSGAVPPQSPPPAGNLQQNYMPPQQQPQYSNPQGSFYAQGRQNNTESKTGVLYWVLFTLLTLFDILMFAGGSGILFTALSAAILIVMFVLRKSISRGVIKPILCFVGAFILTFLIFAFTGTNGGNEANVSVGDGNIKKVAGFSFSFGSKDKPNVVKEGFARSVDQNTLKPIEKTKTFKPDDSIIYYSVLAKYLPEKTAVVAKWYYEGNLVMELGPDIMQNAIENHYYASELQRGEKLFPTGKYKIELIMSKDGKEIYKCSDEFIIDASKP